MSGLPIIQRSIQPGERGPEDLRKVRDSYPWHAKLVATEGNLLPRPGHIGILHILNLGATSADIYLRDAATGTGADATAQRFQVAAGAERWYEIRRDFQIAGRIQGTIPALCEVNALGE